jgi:hypothetical protein
MASEVADRARADDLKSLAVENLARVRVVVSA